MDILNSRATIKAGDRFTNRYGCEAEVIKYTSTLSVTIKFRDSFGYEMISSAGALNSKSFKNPYHPTVWGVGYIGVGPHKSRVNGKYTISYSKWASMLERCYAGHKDKYLPYVGCTVSDSWLNFQTFADWLQVQGTLEGMQIDKDILLQGNMIYSSETCRIVPTEINKAITGGKKNRESELPTGVLAYKGRYIAAITTSGSPKHLGVFNDPETAANAYRLAKIAHVKFLAEKYKASIPLEIYEALLQWVVD